MLIKTGSVVTAVAAALLAVSPLAMAHDSDGHGDHHGHHWGHHDSDGDDDNDNDNGDDDDNGGDTEVGCAQANGAADNRVGNSAGGLLNISDIGAQVPVQACNNSIIEGALGILSNGLSNSDDHSN